MLTDRGIISVVPGKPAAQPLSEGSLDTGLQTVARILVTEANMEIVHDAINWVKV